MSFNFSNDTPIYLQIAELIKKQIISGTYSPGDKLPSVRELSANLKANPNTVQKALSDLEDEGLIVTLRTNGKFVTDNKNIISEKKDATVKKAVEDFFTKMQELGLSEQEIKGLLVDNKEQKWVF